jgi:hypothetical protein
MATATCVKKTVVVAALRSRDLHSRADWVEKELPALIDTARNASLLRTLGINVETPSPEEGPDGQQISPQGRPEEAGEEPEGEAGHEEGQERV